MPISRTDAVAATSGPDGRSRRTPEHPARERLLAAIPAASERRLALAGILTPVLEAGSGPPILLLHGPGEYAAQWLRVIPALARTHRVIAPDLPGHGSSETTGGPLTAERVLAWLDELVQQTCPSAPVLVGHIVGGAIAARYATRHGERLRHLVLVDSLGLAPFQPAPEFGLALHRFVAQPDPETSEALWRVCTYDLDRLRGRMGEVWAPFTEYHLAGVRNPSVQAAMQALLEQFGSAAIPAAELARIEVPTTLIWGRHDLATPLAVAEQASAAHGWPLHVIEECADAPPVEQPEAFLAAVRAALEPAPEQEVVA